MSFREWRARSIVVLCLVWMLSVLAWGVVRSILWARQFQSGSDDFYVIIRVPGGAWLVVGPPLLLLAVWSWQRRSSSVK